MAILAVLAPAASAGAGPFHVLNTSPVNLIAAPPAAQSARLLSDGHNQWSLMSDWASHATVTGRDAEQISLDGETAALSARWAYGRGRWQWSARLGYLFQGGGVLDQFIDEYHELFGFPEGDRPDLPQDELAYRYRRSDGAALNVTGASGGVGDLRIGAAWQALRSDTRALALRATLKLPLGDSDTLAGSGGVDLAVGADGYREVRWLGRSNELYGGFGVQLSDEGDVLGTLRRRVAYYGHAGFSLPFNDTFTFTAQLDAHSALYASELPELGNALQISTGGVWHINPRWDLAIAVVEDLSTRSSPDVTFHFDLRRSVSRRR